VKDKGFNRVTFFFLLLCLFSVGQRKFLADDYGPFGDEQVLKLNGQVPENAGVRLAIATVDFLLSQQKENGSWDVVPKAMMMTRRENGIWMGQESFGEVCGMARALIIFTELNSVFESEKLVDK